MIWSIENVEFKELTPFSGVDTWVELPVGKVSNEQPCRKKPEYITNLITKCHDQKQLELEIELLTKLSSSTHDPESHDWWSKAVNHYMHHSVDLLIREKRIVRFQG